MPPGTPIQDHLGFLQQLPSDTQESLLAIGLRGSLNELAGDHTELETPVPIPNTAVKQLGPMIVRTARK